MSEIGDIASILMLNGGGSLPRKGDNPVLEALIDGALKKSQEPGFFSREAGQKRRAWLDETVNYFTPPELRGPLGLINEANPVTSMERASTASQTMLAPETSGWGRVAAGGEMLSNMAGVVAPAMVAGKAGLPAVNAIEEGLLGWAPGMPAAAGNFLADEFGGMKLYHGSPHDFDKFSMDKIGTGEGAQAYGHGLYFTESDTIARHYRDKVGAMTGKGDLTVDGRKIDWDNPRETAAFEIMRHGGDREAAAAFYEKNFRNSEVPGIIRSGEALPEVNSSGRMYEVDVNANPEDFLDWDAPFQSADDLERFAAKFDGVDPQLRKRIEDYGYTRQQMRQPMPDGNDLLREVFGGVGEKASVRATETMREAGIPGIKYLDAGSRGAGDGSRNYVVFDENLINIVKKYGVAGAATMLGVSQAEVAQAMEGQQ